MVNVWLCTDAKEPTSETAVITATASETAVSDENSSANSNENTETTDNTVREVDFDSGGELNRLNSTESAVSNVTIEESITLLLDKNANHANQSSESSLQVEAVKAPPNSFETSDTLDEIDADTELIEYVVTYEDDETEKLQRRGSCMSRGGSHRAKKKVNLNDSAEIIPPSPAVTTQQSTEEDDEVFSDSIPPMLPRGNMCTPFVTKRGSIPGLAALPDWFREEK